MCEQQGFIETCCSVVNSEGGRQDRMPSKARWVGWWARTHRDESGASLIEFALVLPIFALMLFAMIDLGLSFQSLISLRNGVNAGARMASVDQTDPSCSAAPNPMICTVQDRIGHLLAVAPNSVQVAISFPSASSGAGNTVKVSAQATLQSTTGLTAPFLNGKVICSTSQIRLEQDAGYSAGSTGTVSC
jgi:Flp pilus assembly protein TadG